ncbi:hypothetical protein DF19_12820 [Streptomyces olindensis]|nr:hypothetical protein DF19_12820 [Streptomyces olindensis]
MRDVSRLGPRRLRVGVAGASAPRLLVGGPLVLGSVLRGFRVEPQGLVVDVLFVLRVARRTGHAGVSGGAGLLPGLGPAAVHRAGRRGRPAGDVPDCGVLALLLLDGLPVLLLGGLVLASARVLLGTPLVLLVLFLLRALGVGGLLAFVRGVLPRVPGGGVLLLLLVLGALLLVLRRVLLRRARAARGLLLVRLTGRGVLPVVPRRALLPSGPGLVRACVPLRRVPGLGVRPLALLLDLLRRTGHGVRSRRGIQRRRARLLGLLHGLQQPVDDGRRQT